MLKQRLLILLICILPAFCSTAQVPGYLGYRFSLSVEELVAPNYIGIFQTSWFKDHEGAKFSPFNFTHRFGLDYVVSRSLSIGAFYSPIRTNAYFDDTRQILEGTTTPWINTEQIINAYKLRGTTVGVKFKYFGKRWLAPLGRFTQFDVVYSNYKVKTCEEKTVNYIDYVSEFGDKRYNTLSLCITFGKSRIIKNRIIITRGIQLGYSFGTLRAIMDEYNIVEVPDIFDTANYDKRTMKIWHGQRYFYNLHLGIGVLLF